MLSGIKVLPLIFLIAGCVTPPFRASPSATIRGHSIKRIVVLPPKVDVFEISVGGVREKIDEWSQRGAENLMAALESQLRGEAVQIIRIPDAGLEASLSEDLDQTQLLFDAVNSALMLHTYGPPQHHFEGYSFDLSLGAEVSRLQVTNGEALLIVRATDQITSSGRAALQGATMLAAAALGVIVIPQFGATTLTLALVDAKDGAILWHSFHRSEGGSDLRNAASAASLVRQALSSFPVR